MIKNHIVYSTFSDWMYDLKKAEGSFLWTTKGQKLIDFTSGWNVTNLGWNSPEINNAIVKQAKTNTFAAMWSADEIQNEYAKELADSFPKKLKYVVRATGGTDANEKAMLIARAATKRQTIVGFVDTYHGHSFGTVSIGYRPEFAKDIAPTVPKFTQAIFPKSSGDDKKDVLILKKFARDFEALLKKEHVAAVITEAGIITGWGSTFVAPKGYLTLVRKLTKKYGTLLILDEVGTGFSRCGKLFGLEFENVIPDMVTLAKGMSNGAAAIGAVVVSDDFSEAVLSEAKTTSTFGWVPVACAASLKTLQIHKRDKVWKDSAENGKYLLTQLNKNLKDHPQIGEIQGLGMEIGVMFVKDKKTLTPDNEFANQIILKSFNNGLHLVFGGSGNIQIMPPLTTPKNVLEKGLEIFIDSVNASSKNK